jgi:hypothetical protein
MIHSTPTQITNYFLYAIENKIPYRDTSTGLGHRIKAEGVEIMTKDSRFNPGELFFIKAVKKDIKTLELYDDERVKKLKAKMDKEKGVKIKYVAFSPAIKQNSIIGKTVEIDISAAYWQTAYLLGLITERLYARAQPISWEEALKEQVITKAQYKKCLGLTPSMANELGIIDDAAKSKVGGISKTTRLASIGSLAKREIIRRFTGKRWYVLFDQRDPLAYLWDIICYKVSQVMQEAAKACGKDFRMYWVDAMFVAPSAVPKVEAIFKKHGYAFKSYICETMYTDNDLLKVISKAKAKKLEDGTIKNERVFRLPRANKKK